MKSQKSTERGQVFVLLVLAVIVLLGFTALAIDGGMAYSDRRDAQKGSDAASLAGAGYIGTYFDTNAISSGQWDCSALGYAQNQARVTASAQATKNGYTIDNNPTNNAIVDNHGVRTVCGSDNQGGYIDVITNITRDTETGFAHLVYDGGVRNSVETVTRVRPLTAIGFGNAIVALREECQGDDGGITVSGGAKVKVTDGGIFSNACLVGDGGITVTVDLNGEPGPAIACIGDDCYDDGGTMDPEPVEIPEADREDYRLDRDEFAIPPPDCGAGAYVNHNGGGLIYPGNYNSIRVPATGDYLFMAPGLYCVAKDFTGLGGGVIGHGVTIYLNDVDAYFTTASTTVVKLSAPPQADATAPYLQTIFGGDDEPVVPVDTTFEGWYELVYGSAPGALNVIDPQPVLYPAGSNAIRGLLIYAIEGNDRTIKLAGKASSFYLGTVLTLDGEIHMTGTSDNYAFYSGQFIGDTVTIDGNPIIDITYNDDVVYEDPAELDLHQ